MNIEALTLLLRGLSQRDMRVAELPALAQPVLAPTQLLLAPALAQPVLAPTQLLLAPAAVPGLQRAAVAHAAAHLLHSRAGQDARGRKPLALAVLSAVEDARVERLLITSLPGVRRWFAAFLPATAAPGLGFGALMSRLDRVLADPLAHDGHHWVQRAQQGFWALPADAPPADFAQLAWALANMLGQMRVPFDTQYRPGVPYRDDHSYLWDHGRTGDAEPLPNDAGAAASSGSGGDTAMPVLRERHYGEWHETLGLWRPGWCRVQERSLARGRVAPPPCLRRLPPETEGETLDLPAAVAALVDRRAARHWDPRLFRRTVPPVRASVLLLLDLSQSTLAAWRGGPQTVQAVQQQAALGLARQLASRGARVAVHGFASNGRAQVAYWRAVDFGAPCEADALAAMPVRHSTRLGAALRHAQALLAHEASPRRSLVLLSDGQPWDIDVFEAGHLLHDARRAVDDLRASGVRTRCVTCDAAASAQLQPVFGAHAIDRIDAAWTMARSLSHAGRAILAR